MGIFEKFKIGFKKSASNLTEGLKEIIIKEINPSLKQMFGYKNLYMGPQIYKVVLNIDYY